MGNSGNRLRFVVILSIAMLIRIVFINFQIQIPSVFRYQITSPVASLPNIKESLFFLNKNTQLLSKLDASPPPLLLVFYNYALKVNHNYASLFIDVLTSYFVYRSAKILENVDIINKGRAETCLYTYVFNPITFALLHMFPLQTFQNLFLSITIYAALKKNANMSVMFNMINSTMCVYYISLFPFIYLLLEKNIPLRTYLMWCLIWGGAVFNLNYLITEEYPMMLWKYCRYEFLANSGRPNLGLYWYLMLEMFDEYRLLFSITIHLFNFMFVPGLLVVFKEAPFFAFYVQLAIINICQPYPTLSDKIILLSFLPVFSNLLTATKTTCVLLVAHLFSIVFSVFLIYGSIIRDMTSINFYYISSTVYSTTLVLFIAELAGKKYKQKFAELNPTIDKTKQLIFQ